MRDRLIEVKDLIKIYMIGEIEVPALQGITLKINKGEFVAIMGASGSGKSTFMNIIGCLDRPTSGIYLLEGADIGNLERDERAQIRNKKIGFVFQVFNLIPRTSALENVELPMLYNGTPARERKEKALKALHAVGLTGREDHNPSQLSGGQQQRVAIARALVNEPAIILADEPTGNLDSKTSAEIMKIFEVLNREQGITILLVTHEADIAGYAERVIFFKDGKILKDEKRDVLLRST